MNIIFKYALLCILACPVLIYAQPSAFLDCRIFDIPLAAVTNITQLPSVDVNIEYLEMPSPDGNSYWSALRDQKQKQAYLDHTAPEINHGVVLAESPQLLTGFVGNNSSNGIPLDNHLSISDQGQILSLVNRHLAVKNTAGEWLAAMTLSTFTSALNIPSTKYDPKTLYDPIHDRFIVVMLAGFQSSSSKLILAISETEDASENWIYYVLPGDPFNSGNWSDYPMISLSESSLYITVNQIKDDEPWETGFTETLIWKLALGDLYEADDIVPELFSGIEHNGHSIRNICPVNYATEDKQEDAYFLSNRNFDLENDSIFLIQLSEDPDSGAILSTISSFKADKPYGLPPDVEQEIGYLSTNDSRILDALLIGEEIHFVSNSIDFNTGQATVYHGMIKDIEIPEVEANYLSAMDERAFAYPSLAFTGDDPAYDKDIVIIASHAAESIYSGYSALYRSTDGSYSDWIYAKEGEDYIDMISGMDGFERWGDYSACQRKYNEPGLVWTASSFGEGFKDAETWISCLARPDYVNTTNFKLEQTISLQTYPNPAVERFTVDIGLPEECKRLEFFLFSSEGRLLRVLYDDKPKRKGSVRLSFETATLSSGIYQLIARVNGNVFGRSRFIVQQ